MDENCEKAGSNGEIENTGAKETENVEGPASFVSMILLKGNHSTERPGELETMKEMGIKMEAHCEIEMIVET